MIQKRVHGHSEDSSFVCAPPPETRRETEVREDMDTVLQVRLRSRDSVSYTDSVLPDTASSLLMPPFLGSRSGDRERRAMSASRDDGKGTSRELRDEGPDRKSVFFFLCDNVRDDALSPPGGGVRWYNSKTMTSTRVC
ncbi:hypothetical protein INR49_020606 [Caranx melampygus]|nr:hypothetical protein INR49_020606 [Caranx melampygus]